MQYMQQRTEFIQARCTVAEKAMLLAFAGREGCSLTQAVMRLIRRECGESKDGAKALKASAGRPAAEKRHNGSSRRGRGRP